MGRLGNEISLDEERRGGGGSERGSGSAREMETRQRPRMAGQRVIENVNAGVWHRRKRPDQIGKRGTSKDQKRQEGNLGIREEKDRARWY